MGLTREAYGLPSRASNFWQIEPEKDLLKETETQKKSVTKMTETKVEELVAGLGIPAWSVCQRDSRDMDEIRAQIQTVTLREDVALKE